MPNQSTTERNLSSLLFNMVLVVFLCIPASVLAQSYTATKDGETKCRSSLDLAKKREMKRAVPHGVFAWTQGFISGMNVARGLGPSGKEPIKTSGSELWTLVEEHCQNNPEDSRIDMATKIYLKLAQDQVDQ